jgi:hypothetical protein
VEEGAAEGAGSKAFQSFRAWALGYTARSIRVKSTRLSFRPSEPSPLPGTPFQVLKSCQGAPDWIPRPKASPLGAPPHSKFMTSGSPRSLNCLSASNVQ